VTRRGLIGERLPRTALAALLSLTGYACASAPAAPSGRPSTTATLEITSPAPNQVIGRVVDVKLRLNEAHLVSPTQIGGRLRADQGHIHLSVDGQLVAMPLTLDQPLPPLSPGSHTVEAEFVASDHRPFANRVVAAVAFEVR
jgi:hypothetical protein